MARERGWRGLQHRDTVSILRRKWLDNGGTDRIRIPKAERLEAVAELRAAGMTIPDTAAALGVSPSTIDKDSASRNFTRSRVSTESDLAQVQRNRDYGGSTESWGVSVLV
ncbi:helix-turn-helix domain-containing protein [Amycolatopsis sp. A1MSW2902]|uniref:helix-turn-helix domain-containing protein n=1 Tax=Amycolatopsis sp. A1MSW2902 TaxID=687413 RepID=UPI003FCD64A2